MNKLVAAALFATAGGLLFAPQPVRADDSDVVAAVGGFIGGLIVGSALDDDHHHYDLHHGAPVHVSTRIVIGGGHGHHHHHHHRHGHWEWTRVRVWVPGHWVVREDYCGRRIRYFEPGRHVYRRERVWIAGGPCSLCG